MHQIIMFSWLKKKGQHLHFVITDAICKNLLQNAAKFITYCVQIENVLHYYIMGRYYIM